jgi:hypothetical protein
MCHRDRKLWQSDAETAGIRFDAEPRPIAYFDYVSGQYVVAQEVEDCGNCRGNIPSD